jgi:hypothetical protein
MSGAAELRDSDLRLASYIPIAIPHYYLTYNKSIAVVLSDTTDSLQVEVERKS